MEELAKYAREWFIINEVEMPKTSTEWQKASVRRGEIPEGTNVGKLRALGITAGNFIKMIQNQPYFLGRRLNPITPKNCEQRIGFLWVSYKEQKGHKKVSVKCTKCLREDILDYGTMQRMYKRGDKHCYVCRDVGGKAKPEDIYAQEGFTLVGIEGKKAEYRCNTCYNTIHRNKSYGKSSEYLVCEHCHPEILHSSGCRVECEVHGSFASKIEYLSFLKLLEFFKKEDIIRQAKYDELFSTGTKHTADFYIPHINLILEIGGVNMKKYEKTKNWKLSQSNKVKFANSVKQVEDIVRTCLKKQDKPLQTAEMYYAACLSGDKALQQVFIEGHDFHGSIAKDAFNLPCEADQVKELYGVERTAAKAISFGILYGSAPPKVAQTVNEFKEEQGLKPDFTVAEAEEAISNYFNRYKVLKKWLDARKAEISEFGFIYSALGRKRRVKNALSDDRGVAASSIRSAVNFLIQSVASDGTAAGAEKLAKQTKDMDVKIFALVHDSVVAEVGIKDLKSYIAKAQDCLQNAIPIQIPGCPIGLDFEIGKTYAFKESDVPDLSAA